MPTPVVTQGPVLPWNIHTPALTFDDAGNMLTARVEVYYRQRITVDGTELTNNLPTVSWDAVATAALSYTLTLPDGTTVQTTRGAILGAVLGIAAQEQAKTP